MTRRPFFNVYSLLFMGGSFSKFCAKTETETNANTASDAAITLFNRISKLLDLYF
jgi:hypothetical protein